MTTDLPAWDTLTARDKATLAAFLRAIDTEGIDYAIEEYPPTFHDSQALKAATAGELHDTYHADYKALPIDEFCRLYNQGMRQWATTS